MRTGSCAENRAFYLVHRKSSPRPSRPLHPYPCPGRALPHLQAPPAPRRAPRDESSSRLRAPWLCGRWRARWSGRQWVSGLGEAAVAAGAAAASAPSGPDCGDGDRRRGQGAAEEGEGSEESRRRGGAGTRKLGEGRWGRSCWGGRGASPEPRAREGFRRLSDRCCGAWRGSTFPYPLPAPPHLRMSLPRPAPLSPPIPQQAQGGTVGNTALLNRAKRQASLIFLWIKDPLSLENVGSREGGLRARAGGGSQHTYPLPTHTYLAPPRYPKFCPVFLTSIPTLSPPHPQKKFLRVGGREVEFPRKSFQDSSLRNTKPLYSPPLLPQNNS